MNKRPLLILTSVLEMATGLALIASPSLLASVLFGSTLDTPVAMTIGRVAGASLLTLGAACWLARNDVGSRSAIGLIGAMLFYNIVAVVIFVYAGLGEGVVGVGFWPVVLVHMVLAIWCILGLGPIGMRVLFEARRAPESEQSIGTRNDQRR